MVKSGDKEAASLLGLAATCVVDAGLACVASGVAVDVAEIG